MRNSYEKVASRTTPSDYDSDSDSNHGPFEKTETRQEMVCTYPTSSSRHSNSQRGQLPLYDNDSMCRKHDRTDGDLLSLFQRTTITNLFGRTLNEASFDLQRIIRPQRSTQNDATPSLTSDDTPSRSSSSSVASPVPVHRKLGPPLSPRTRDGPPNFTPQMQDISENAAVSTLPTTETEPALICYSPEASSPEPSSPPAYHDEGAMRNFGSIPDQSTLATTSDRDTYSNREFNPLRDNNTHPPITKHIPPTKVSSRKAPVIIRTVEGEEERDELVDDDEDNDYTPIPPTQTLKRLPKPERQRIRKSIGSFKCEQCSRLFTRNFDKERHVKSVHEEQSKDDIISRTCSCCGVVLSRGDAFKRHSGKIPKACFRLAELRKSPLTKAQKEEVIGMIEAGKPPRFPQEVFVSKVS